MSEYSIPTNFNKINLPASVLSNVSSATGALQIGTNLVAGDRRAYSGIYPAGAVILGASLFGTGCIGTSISVYSASVGQTYVNTLLLCTAGGVIIGPRTVPAALTDDTWFFAGSVDGKADAQSTLVVTYQV